MLTDARWPHTPTIYFNSLKLPVFQASLRWILRHSRFVQHTWRISIQLSCHRFLYRFILRWGYRSLLGEPLESKWVVWLPSADESTAKTGTIQVSDIHRFGFWQSVLVVPRITLKFRSSYDPSVRMLAGHGYRGPVCFMGHRLKGRVYDRSGRHCDRCESDIESGSSGKCCKVALT